MSEREALVALLRLDRRPWSEYREYVEDRGGAGLALERELTEPGGQGILLAEDPASLLTRAHEEIERWEASGIRLLTVLDSEYPRNLRLVHDHPPLLFVRGELKPEDDRSIAVVGSRSASTDGIRASTAIAQGLVAGGWTVVSGLALGIDAAAHRAALEAGGRTVAVIGTGLWRTYPPDHTELQRSIADRCAVVSQFWPEAPPSRRSFPLRNAVMSGMARATVVVEASHRSGARIQARLALAHGRPVLLMQRLLTQAWAEELAQRPGVYVVAGASEISAVVDRLDDGALTE
ncbi:MAG: DNA-processing protein DprA [Solirubrobacteraceae bacterium]